MSMISIPITDDERFRLQSLAERAGLSVEELLRRCVEPLLERSDDDFAAAAKHVLAKNAELYRRLA